MKKPTTSARRTAQLRALLEERRRELTVGVTDLKRDVRTRSEHARVPDGQDGVDVEHRDDLDLALLQMRGETLSRIDAALRRLEAGTYGICGDCDQLISSERLQALPFAARCRPCEEAREAAATPRRSATTKAYTYHAIE
jgi:DnaK suppressor protein